MARVLILTPVKDGAHFVAGYFERLRALDYDLSQLSIGLLESDSRDDSHAQLTAAAKAQRGIFRSVRVWKRDFGYHVPPTHARHYGGIQLMRRSVLARSRNHLLARALGDEAWVLWLDVDVIEYPPTILRDLLAYKQPILQPHCVLDYGGPTFDTNAWRDQGRLHLQDLRAHELTPLDTVGGTMLLIAADCHRDGLIFPSFLYGVGNPRTRNGGGEIETEGLGIMAHDMGYTPIGVPNLEIRHHRG